MVHKLLKTLILLVITGFLQQAKSQSVDSLNLDTLESDLDSLANQVVQIPVKASRIDSLIQYAYTFMGANYRRGGIGAKGFDCSGYTMTVFKQFGIKLPHTSAGQGLVGLTIAKSNIKKGDLILFKGRSRKSGRIGHVGIVISEKNEPIRFIHSSTSNGVRIDRLEYLYYKKRYVKAVRFIELYQ